MMHSGKVLAGIAAAMLFPAAAGAQTIARSFDELQRVLKVGQPVVVTDETGQKTKGEVAKVSGSSLTLRVPTTTRNPTGTRTFGDNAITKVTPRDSLRNGTLIGLGAGAAAAWVFLRANCGPPGYDPECSAIAGPIGALIFVPAGTAAGALIDRGIGNNPLYLSPSRLTRASAVVSPWIDRGSGGMALSIRF